MLPVIEKLLILQDRDRRLSQVQGELASLQPQKTNTSARVARAKADLDAVKLHAKQLESDRKKLELDVDAKKQQIEKYSVQQFQTKKNDEYQALGREITNCKRDIVALEDGQLDLMEKLEAAQRNVITATRIHEEALKEVDKAMATLAARERDLEQRLAELSAGRESLAAEVGTDLLPRYERLRRNKGDRVVVGIEHSVCGGCHMKLPTQILVTTRGAQELATCPNCSRLLYHTSDMELTPAD